MNTILEGITVVDSPLPYAVMGVYVDERCLTEEIGLAWTGCRLYERAIRDQMEALARGTFSGATPMSKADHQLFERAVKAEQSHVTALEMALGDMLFTMKAVMSRPGREGDWGGFLQTQGIPLATAETLAKQCRRRLKRKTAGQRMAWRQ